MVLCDHMLGLEVEVTTEGTPLKEHEDAEPEKEKRTVTRSIEATFGQEFAVSLKLRPDFVFKGDCIAARVEADCIVLTSAILYFGGEVREVEGIELGDGTIRKARFASVEIGELERRLQ